MLGLHLAHRSINRQQKQNRKQIHSAISPEAAPDDIEDNLIFIHDSIEAVPPQTIDEDSLRAEVLIVEQSIEPILTQYELPDPSGKESEEEIKHSLCTISEAAVQVRLDSLPIGPGQEVQTSIWGENLTELAEKRTLSPGVCHKVRQLFSAIHSQGSKFPSGGIGAENICQLAVPALMLHMINPKNRVFWSSGSLAVHSKRYQAIKMCFVRHWVYKI